MNNFLKKIDDTLDDLTHAQKSLDEVRDYSGTSFYNKFAHIMNEIDSVTQVLNIERSRMITYAKGDKFEYKAPDGLDNTYSGKYMLAMYDDIAYMVSLDDGSCWYEGIEVEDALEITYDELTRIIGSDRIDHFTKVE